MCGICLVLGWKSNLCLFPEERAALLLLGESQPSHGCHTLCLLPVWAQGAPSLLVAQGHAHCCTSPSCPQPCFSQAQHSTAAGEKFLQAFWDLKKQLPSRASGEELGQSRVSCAVVIMSLLPALVSRHPVCMGLLFWHGKWRLLSGLLTERLPVGAHVFLGL